MGAWRRCHSLPWQRLRAARHSGTTALNAAAAALLLPLLVLLLHAPIQSTGQMANLDGSSSIDTPSYCGGPATAADAPLAAYTFSGTPSSFRAEWEEAEAQGAGGGFASLWVGLRPADGSSSGGLTQLQGVGSIATSPNLRAGSMTAGASQILGLQVWPAGRPTGHAWTDACEEGWGQRGRTGQQGRVDDFCCCTCT